VKKKLCRWRVNARKFPLLVLFKYAISIRKIMRHLHSSLNNKCTLLVSEINSALVGE